MGIRVNDLPAAAIVTVSPTVQCVEFDIHVRTVTESNAKELFYTRQKRAKLQRAATRRAMIGLRLPPLPVLVTMTRHSAGVMDDDNLAGCFKHVRDEIASLYGCGDSARDPIRWVPAQMPARPRSTPRVSVVIQPQ